MEGANNTCSSMRGSICQQHFSETEKRRSFSTYYKFEKFDPIHSIFAFQNGRPKTTKRSSKAKISNGKNRSQRYLLQHSPASRSTEVCKVSVVRESIPIHMSLFWSGIYSQNLQQTLVKIFTITILRRINIRLIIYLKDILIMVQLQHLGL